MDHKDLRPMLAIKVDVTRRDNANRPYPVTDTTFFSSYQDVFKHLESMFATMAVGICKIDSVGEPSSFVFNTSSDKADIYYIDDVIPIQSINIKLVNVYSKYVKENSSMFVFDYKGNKLIKNMPKEEQLDSNENDFAAGKGTPETSA